MLRILRFLFAFKNVDVQKETPRQILLFSHRNVTPKVIATVKMGWIWETTDALKEVSNEAFSVYHGCQM